MIVTKFIDTMFVCLCSQNYLVMGNEDSNKVY